MTPNERAEKIRITLEPLVKLGPSIIEFIAKEIVEAEREAIEWKVKEMLSEPFMLAHFCKGRGEGFSAARDKAAGIAERYQRRRNSHRFLAHHIAARIRQMSPEGIKRTCDNPDHMVGCVCSPPQKGE